MTDTRTLNVPLNDSEEDLSIELLAGGGSSIPAVWGNITGTITNQIDLAEKLNEKISTPDGGTVGQFLQKTENGTQWADGEKGDTGEKGDKGDKGEKGDKGDKGDDGNDYVLTSADKTEIANTVYGMIESAEGSNY